MAKKIKTPSNIIPWFITRQAWSSCNKCLDARELATFKLLYIIICSTAMKPWQHHCLSSFWYWLCFAWLQNHYFMKFWNGFCFELAFLIFLYHFNILLSKTIKHALNRHTWAETMKGGCPRAIEQRPQSLQIMAYEISEVNS